MTNDELIEQFYEAWDNDADYDELAEILEKYVRVELPNYDETLDTIAALKYHFESDLPHRPVAEAVDAELAQCRRVRWQGRDYGVVDQRKDSANRKSIPPSKRDEIMERDDYSCVRCGSDDDLEIHHIIPVSHGGLNHDENLATLCEECNLTAHAGDYSSRRLIYDGKREFWKQFATGDIP